MLHDGGNDTGSVPQSTTSLDDKLDYFNKELTAMKSEMKRFAESLDTKESISNLKLARLESEMMHLNKNLTTQMTSFCEKISAKISVLDANMESRLDKFESRFLFRIVFVVSDLRTYYMIPSNKYEGSQCSCCSGWYRRCHSPTIPKFYDPDSYDPGPSRQTCLKQESLRSIANTITCTAMSRPGRENMLLD